MDWNLTILVPVNLAATVETEVCARVPGATVCRSLTPSRCSLSESVVIFSPDRDSQEISPVWWHHAILVAKRFGAISGLVPVENPIPGLLNSLRGEELQSLEVNWTKCSFSDAPSTFPTTGEVVVIVSEFVFALFEVWVPAFRFKNLEATSPFQTFLFAHDMSLKFFAVTLTAAEAAHVTARCKGCFRQTASKFDTPIVSIRTKNLSQFEKDRISHLCTVFPMVKFDKRQNSLGSVQTIKSVCLMKQVVKQQKYHNDGRDQPEYLWYTTPVFCSAWFDLALLLRGTILYNEKNFSPGLLSIDQYSFFKEVWTPIGPDSTLPVGLCILRKELYSSLKKANIAVDFVDFSKKSAEIILARFLDKTHVSRAVAEGRWLFDNVAFASEALGAAVSVNATYTRPSHHAIVPLTLDGYGVSSSHPLNSFTCHGNGISAPVIAIDSAPTDLKDDAFQCFYHPVSKRPTVRTHIACPLRNHHIVSPLYAQTDKLLPVAQERLTTTNTGKGKNSMLDSEPEFSLSFTHSFRDQQVIPKAAITTEIQFDPETFHPIENSLRMYVTEDVVLDEELTFAQVSEWSIGHLEAIHPAVNESLTLLLKLFEADEKLSLEEDFFSDLDRHPCFSQRFQEPVEVNVLRGFRLDSLQFKVRREAREKGHLFRVGVDLPFVSGHIHTTSFIGFVKKLYTKALHQRIDSQWGFRVFSGTNQSVEEEEAQILDHRLSEAHILDFIHQRRLLRGCSEKRVESFDQVDFPTFDQVDISAWVWHQRMTTPHSRPLSRAEYRCLLRLLPHAQSLRMGCVFAATGLSEDVETERFFVLPTTGENRPVWMKELHARQERVLAQLKSKIPTTSRGVSASASPTFDEVAIIEYLADLGLADRTLSGLSSEDGDEVALKLVPPANVENPAPKMNGTSPLRAYLDLVAQFLALRIPDEKTDERKLTMELLQSVAENLSEQRKEISTTDRLPLIDFLLEPSMKSESKAMFFQGFVMSVSQDDVKVYLEALNASLVIPVPTEFSTFKSIFSEVSVKASGVAMTPNRGDNGDGIEIAQGRFRIYPISGHCGRYLFEDQTNQFVQSIQFSLFPIAECFEGHLPSSWAPPLRAWQSFQLHARIKERSQGVQKVLEKKKKLRLSLNDLETRHSA